MIPLLLFSAAVGATIGAFVNHAAGEKDRQEAQQHKKVANELTNKYSSLEKRYNELADESKKQINDQLRQIALKEKEIDGLRLALRLQQNLISLMHSIDKKPSCQNLNYFREAVRSTNILLSQLHEELISIPNDYFIRNLDSVRCQPFARVEEAEYFHLYGQILHDQGKYKEAIYCYERAIDLDSKNYRNFWKKGTSLFQLGRYREALLNYNTAIAIEPNNPDVWGARAVVRYNLGDVEGEFEDNQKVLRLNPSYAQICYAQGVLSEMLGDTIKALEYYNQALRIDSSYAEAYYRRGVLNLTLGDPMYSYHEKIYRQQGREDLQRAELLFSQQGQVMPPIPSKCINITLYTFLMHPTG
jgi:tetratricopeptide (TPR) repeat protein